MTKEKRLFFLSSGKMINTIQVKHKKKRQGYLKQKPCRKTDD